MWRCHHSTAAVWLAGLLGLLVSVPVAGIDYAIDPADAAFLVVTKKEGVGSRFAHDHLIAAHDFKATLSAPAGEPEKGRFVLDIGTAALTFDAPVDQQQHLAALTAAGVRSQPFAPIPEADRVKIRQHALDASQLDAGAHPRIRAVVAELRREPMSFGGKLFSHTATVRVTIRGQTVEKRLPANVALTGQELSVESVGLFAFSEFGIAPYSALLGAIRNADPFHIYVAFRARPR